MDCATRATWVILPNAAMKSLQVNSRCNLPCARVQPCKEESCCCTSSSVSFLACIGKTSWPGGAPAPLCVAPGEAATTKGRGLPDQKNSSRLTDSSGGIFSACTGDDGAGGLS